MMVPSVPISLPLTAFLRWLDSTGESPWLPASHAQAIRSGRLPSVGTQIRETIAQNRSAWDAWVGEVQAQGREAECTLDEWVALMQGGRDMWSIRAERLFTDPSEHSATLGWVVPEDVVRWTGRVRLNHKEPKYKTWYEVELTKADKQLRAWYKAGLLDEFFAPTPAYDLAVSDNRLNVFDSQAPSLPADPEIDDAQGRLRGAVHRRTARPGVGTITTTCAGSPARCPGFERCSVAAEMAGRLPAREIIEKDRGTYPDLRPCSMSGLSMSSIVRRQPPITPTCPPQVDTGMMAIVHWGHRTGQ
jgi:hypothetical protein